MPRVPFTLVAITPPIDPSTAATIANATSASIRVNPLVPSEQLFRDNLDASGQPVDANLIAHARPRQRDGAAARHPRRKEIDRAAGVAVGAFWSCVITFTMFEAAYYSEIMRAGIQSIPKGQVAAGQALGLNYWQ